ncbi:terpene synthase family protein [Streptomyces sp. SBT349]|uniref:terpene synthase family protein n=1 Tax=Streptomyces sp. SBT349 TaxID=1580539 RepID=UPI000B22C881|nr:terpene synthase family protein [Streptomyces sp. SBT349]
MTGSSSGAVPRSEALMAWARGAGLVTDPREERRLAAMRLEVLAGGAVPGGRAADVALTTQWAAFICWVDDHIDRRGLGSVPGELERFTASLRRVLAPGERSGAATAPHALVLAGLWERTASGMSAGWRERFTADYTDFLDASEEEVALRRAGARLPLREYVRLRRRTITLLPMLDVLEHTGHAPLVEAPGVNARVRDLRWAVADVAGWVNDLASGADDAAVGQDNLVAVVAREYACSPARARGRVAAMIRERRSGLATTAAELRAGSGLLRERGEDLRRHVDLVETFMAATLRWLATTGRFAPGTRAHTSVGPAEPPA